MNWLEERRDEREFVGRDPQVVVVGAGQAGLTIAARLTQLGVSTLIVEKNDRVGDNWRSRYRSLVLHDPVWYDHLPYMPFPAHWPVFTPKDKLAGWLESYVDALELNVWTNARFVGGDYDEGSQTLDGTNRSRRRRAGAPSAARRARDRDVRRAERAHDCRCRNLRRTDLPLERAHRRRRLCRQARRRRRLLQQRARHRTGLLRARCPGHDRAALEHLRDEQRERHQGAVRRRLRRGRSAGRGRRS